MSDEDEKHRSFRSVLRGLPMEKTTFRRILVIDDSPEFSSMFVRFLKRYGYEVTKALDGLEGLEKARLEKPDLIVLDVMLPGMNGHKVCRMIKFDQQLKKIPILVLTSRMSEGDEQLAYQCGADAFIAKGTENLVILAKIKNLLRPSIDDPLEVS